MYTSPNFEVQLQSELQVWNSSPSSCHRQLCVAVLFGWEPPVSQVEGWSAQAIHTVTNHGGGTRCPFVTQFWRNRPFLLMYSSKSCPDTAFRQSRLSRAQRSGDGKQKGHVPSSAWRCGRSGGCAMLQCLMEQPKYSWSWSIFSCVKLIKGC
jgi:hypothetical protein